MVHSDIEPAELGAGETYSQEVNAMLKNVGIFRTCAFGLVIAV